jgi:hypothetical protein
MMNSIFRIFLASLMIFAEKAVQIYLSLPNNLTVDDNHVCHNQHWPAHSNHLCMAYLGPGPLVTP